MEANNSQSDATTTETKDTAITGLPQHEIEAPDPDEDDLDLDDLLDEFSTTKKQSREESQAQSLRTHEKSDSQSSEVHTATNDFNQQLQDQMAALLGEVDESPDMVRDIEAMMQELGVAADTSPATGTQNGTPNAVPPPGVETPFQKTIWEAMERIQTSGEQAPPAVPKDSDDLLAQMLKEMQGGDSGAAGSEEEFSKMLMGMMEHLTNKDILYDPMKELHDKFPQWMDRNRGKLSADDLQRYETQQRLVKDIVLRFEQKTYTDANVEDREYIVERMQQMQSAGSPPADLVGDMSGAQEALGDLNSSCPQQ